MHLRSLKKTANDAYLSDPIGTDKEGNQITLQDKLAGEGYTIDEQITLDTQICLLRKVLKLLSQREREIIAERYGLYGKDEATQKEIAKRQDISRSYVKRLRYYKSTDVQKYNCDHPFF